MKLRRGFVSNSSSSSFLIIDDSGTRTTYFPIGLLRGHALLCGDRMGETEFGWGPNKLWAIEDRINLSVLMARMYSEDPDMRLKQILRVIQKYHPEVQELRWESCESAYVDHQSVDRILEMFDSDTTLENFLFGKGSCIVLDNDNH